MARITVMHRARIILHWLQQGAANHSPRGQHFTLPARFEHQGDDWIEDAWSLVVEVDGVPESNGQQYGIARFLMPTAPQDWLTAGKEFTIFEGELALARGSVVEVLSE
jgi:hypothetical protein